MRESIDARYRFVTRVSKSQRRLLKKWWERFASRGRFNLTGDGWRISKGYQYIWLPFIKIRMPDFNDWTFDKTVKKKRRMGLRAINGLRVVVTSGDGRKFRCRIKGDRAIASNGKYFIKPKCKFIGIPVVW